MHQFLTFLGGLGFVVGACGVVAGGVTLGLGHTEAAWPALWGSMGGVVIGLPLLICGLFMWNEADKANEAKAFS